MVAGVETQDDGAARRFFNAETLGANRHPTVGANFKDCADAPHIIPPGTRRSWAKGGTVFHFGLVPRAQRSLTQFTMNFLRVAMGSERVNVCVGGLNFADVFTGKKGGQASLPKLVFAFDLAFGVGRELHPMQTMQNSFSRSRILSIRGAAGDLN